MQKKLKRILSSPWLNIINPTGIISLIFIAGGLYFDLKESIETVKSIELKQQQSEIEIEKIKVKVDMMNGNLSLL